jgi:hypothetical protein
VGRTSAGCKPALALPDRTDCPIEIEALASSGVAFGDGVARLADFRDERGLAGGQYAALLSELPLPVEVCKAGLAGLLRKPSAGIALNAHCVGHGDTVYQQACKLGCEGIVSKRLGSTYRSGRSTQWVIKNPAAPAVRREAEDNWRR